MDNTVKVYYLEKHADEIIFNNNRSLFFTKCHQKVTNTFFLQNWKVTQ